MQTIKETKKEKRKSGRNTHLNFLN